MGTDIFGQALLDYIRDESEGDITTYISLGETDTLSIAYLFRDYDHMPKLERKALDLSRGKVLDVGCGSGSHSLHLQEKGLDVTALDISPATPIPCINSKIVSNFVPEYSQILQLIVFLRPRNLQQSMAPGDISRAVISNPFSCRYKL